MEDNFNQDKISCFSFASYAFMDSRHELSENVAEVSPKKVRRSQRLAERCTKPDVSPASSLGVFRFMPTELMFKVFEKLNLSSLGIVSICSKALRDQVLTYLGLHSTVEMRFPDRRALHLRLPCSNSVSLSVIATQLGILVKRLTCLLPTKTRIEFFLEKVLPTFDCSKPSNHCVRPAGECEAPVLLGDFLQALAAGWVLSELISVAAALSDSPAGSQASARTRSLLGPPAVLVAVTEGDTRWRHFNRAVYLDSSPNHATEVFWLRAILHQMEPALHGRALFLLYGPCINGQLQKQGMHTTPVLCKTQGRSWFIELAKVLAIMARHSDGAFSEQSLVAVVEDIVSRPRRWLPMNVAQLLFCCRRDLVVAFLVQMLSRGKLQIVGQIFAMLTLVNLLAADNVNWLLDLVELVLGASVIRSRFQLRTLYRHINDAFETEVVKLFVSARDREDDSQLDIVRNFLRAITMFQIGITQLSAFKALI